MAAMALLVAAAAAPVKALEPRFDHRDQQGLSLEFSGTYDNMTSTGTGGVSRSFLRTTLRLAYSLDVRDGNEIRFGAGWSPRVSDAPESPRLSLDARYRGYFGTEELKTFFDVGLWGSVDPKLALGPRAGIGATYDFGRSTGVFAAFGVATALGQFRGVSIGFETGLQWRWP
jgi:hypothetical protein